MQNFELYIEPERPQRNLKNGRFLKGSTPYCKGKKWAEFIPAEKRERCLANLKIGRRLKKGRIPESIESKKIKVIMIKDGKPILYNSMHDAGRYTGLDYRDIHRCCKCNKKFSQRIHYTHGFTFYYESEFAVWSKMLKDMK